MAKKKLTGRIVNPQVVKLKKKIADLTKACEQKHTLWTESRMLAAQYHDNLEAAEEKMRTLEAGEVRRVKQETKAKIFLQAVRAQAAVIAASEEI